MLHKWGASYGSKAETPSSSVCITTVAKIIWEMVYARLATPAAWPRKLHHPMIQDQAATCSGGTTCFVT